MPPRPLPRKPALPAVQVILRPLDLALHELQVELQLPADAVANGTVLALPTWTPGSYLVRDYARFLDRVVLRDSKGKTLAVEKLDKQRWRIPACRTECTLIYRLYGNDLTVRTNHVDGSHAHLVGAASFLYLEDQRDRPYELQFQGWPGTWGVATALPAKQGRFRARNHDELVDSPIEIGTFRNHEWTSGKAAFQLAVTGDHCGDEGRILEGVQRIVAVCGGMFGGFPFDRYVFLLTFSPGARGGLEHRDSTSLLADPFALGKPEGYYELFTLIAHEFFHAWNVKRLRASELGPFDYSKENPTKLLWFHEGFTSFLQYGLVMKSGTAPWSWVAQKLAQTWTDNTTRQGRLEQNLEEASFDAWIRFYKPTEFSPNSTVSYYEKGAMIAWMMDAKIRLASGGKRGLDDYLRMLWRQFGDAAIRDEDLREAYGKLCDEDPEPFWRDYIGGVQELDAAAIEKAYGLRLVPLAPWEALPSEEHEDPAAVARARVYTGLVCQGDSPTIQNVFPGSPAAEAGLAYNQEILAVNGWRTTTGAEVTRRTGDLRVGDSLEILASDRGRVKRVVLTLQENPHRVTRIVRAPKVSPAQREAFRAWTGCGKGQP